MSMSTSTSVEATNTLEINDFIAQYLCEYIKEFKKELKIKDISPLELELLYGFAKLDNITEKEISERNTSIDAKEISELLHKMQERKWIIKGSPWKITDIGKKFFDLCIKIQVDAEMIINSDLNFKKMNEASSTSIKV